MRTIAIDFETYYDKECTVKRLGNWGYTRHPAFDAYMVSVTDGEQSWCGHPKDFNWDALADSLLLAHNAAFDSSVYDALVEKGLAPRLNVRWQCTANLTSYLCNRRDLKGSAAYLLGRSMSKEMRGKATGMRYEDFVAKGMWDDMVKYAAGDAEACYQLWLRFHSRWPAHEQFLSQHTMDMMRHGVQINEELLYDYIDALTPEVIRLNKVLPWIAAGEKPTSPKAIAEQCKKTGIPVPPVKAHYEEAWDNWLEAHADIPWVKAISEYRIANKMLTMLNTLSNRVRGDGRVECQLKYWGGHTGRYSGDAGFNFQNMRRRPLKLPCGTAVDVRKLWVAKPGHKLVISDLTQIEPRVLNWYAKDWAFLELLATGMNVYEAHARVAMGWTGGKLKEEDPDTYKIAKIRVLQLGYQSGAEKLRTTMIRESGEDVPLERCQQIVEEFRASSPKVVDLWKQFDTVFKGSVGDDYITQLPNGREMLYEKVQQSSEFVREEDENGKSKMVRKRKVTAEVGGKRYGFYGGKLVENLVQATARDVFVEGLIRLAKAGAKHVFHVHDEHVLEVPSDVDVKDVHALVAQPVEWLPGCPIGSSVAETPHYMKD